MKRIAVLGIGAMGAIVGGGLASAGQDVALICTSWRANAEHLRKRGLIVMDESGSERHTRVNAVFLDDLPGSSSMFEVVFVTTKSNDTERCLRAILPHLATAAVVVSLQNGLNEETIAPIVGSERVVACVSYTGGSLLRPGYVRTHGGTFVLGELDGRVTPRVREIADLLDLVAPTRITDDVIRQRWDKLAQVTATVPVGAIAGVGFPAILLLEEAHPVLARLTCETLTVAAAAGSPLAEVAGLTTEEWARLAAGPAPDLAEKVVGPFASCPGTPTFDPDEAPLLKDLKLGLPLEIDYTNGYVIEKGRQLGIPTPAHEMVMGQIKAMERKELIPGRDQLSGLAALSGGAGYRDGRTPPATPT